LRSTFGVPDSNPIVAGISGQQQFRIAPNMATGQPEK
jgi:hypothetical protein